MLSLSEDTQFEVIEAFNSTSGYLDDLLNIANNFFDSMAIIFTLENFSYIRLMSQILMPYIWINIYLYRMVLFRLKLLINEMTLSLIL